MEEKDINLRWYTDGWIYKKSWDRAGFLALKDNISDGKCTGGVRPALWLKL